MNWNAIVDRVTPHIVKIETPNGHGTGFVCLYNDDRTLCGIATAGHVVIYADDWQQPIRIQQSSKTVFLKESERVIWPDRNTESAIILVQAGEFDFPENLIPLLPINVPLSIGSEVAWLGYPAVAPYSLCFFYVSNRATGETLPGLAIAQDVSYFHNIISKIRSLGEADRQKKEQQSQESSPPAQGDKSLTTT